MMDRKLILLCSFFVIVFVVIIGWGIGSTNKERAERAAIHKAEIEREKVVIAEIEREKAAIYKAKIEREKAGAAKVKIEREKVMAAKVKAAIAKIERAKIERDKVAMAKMVKEKAAAKAKAARDKIERDKVAAKASRDAAIAEIKREQEAAQIEAWVVSQEFIKDYLKSPGTADWGSFFGGDYQDPKTCVTYILDDTYRVRGWVDSQNSFGGIVRSNFLLTVKDKGNGNWSLVNPPIMTQRR